MAQITLHYSTEDVIAQKTIEYLLSLGIFKAARKKKDAQYSDVFKEKMRKSKSSGRRFVNVNDVWK